MSFRIGRTNSYNSGTSSTGIVKLASSASLNEAHSKCLMSATTTLVRTPTCPTEWLHRIKHREPSIIGENFFSSWIIFQNLVFEEEKLVLRYSEIEHYTFGVDQGAPGTGHFTQVIGFMMPLTFLRTAMFYHDDDHFDFRWCGKEALMLELALLRREARSSFSYFSLLCIIFSQF